MNLPRTERVPEPPLNEINQTSLLPHCLPCGSACCRYSSPILDQWERDRIFGLTGKDYFERISTADGSYYVIGRNADGSPRHLAPQEKTKGDPCPFLDTDGRCSIHHIKPMDCAAYPVRAVPLENGSLSWHLHRSCPAAPSLSPAFVDRAKLLAEKSARRFSRKTYVDWLDRFSRWTLSADSFWK